MRSILAIFVIILSYNSNALAHTDQDLTFTIDVTAQKDEAKAMSAIQKAAKKKIKADCPKKTKFQAEMVTVNVGLGADGKYTGNANYHGVCKIK